MGREPNEKEGLPVFDEWKVEESTFSDGLEDVLREFLVMVREEDKGFTKYLSCGPKLWCMIESYDFGRIVNLETI